MEKLKSMYAQTLEQIRRMKKKSSVMQIMQNNDIEHITRHPKDITFGQDSGR